MFTRANPEPAKTRVVAQCRDAEFERLVRATFGLDGKVELFVATSYNAEIEAMRNDKLEIGEFGPLGYVLAHQVAHAEAVATFAGENGQPATYTASIVTWPGSGVKTLADIKGQSFAYSDPSSTSGHLFPAYGLSKNGIDPDHGVKALYAGSHTASFEALRNHKVQAGELNSEEIASAKRSAPGTLAFNQFRMPTALSLILLKLYICHIMSLLNLTLILLSAD